MTRFWKGRSPSIWLHTLFLRRRNYPLRADAPHVVIFLEDPRAARCTLNPLLLVAMRTPVPTLPPCAPSPGPGIRLAIKFRPPSSSVTQVLLFPWANAETGSERPSNLCQLTQQESGKARIIGQFFCLQSLLHFHCAQESGWFRK